MKKKVEVFAKEYQMLDKNDKVIVGVSGGTDSVCLLFMLMELKKDLGFEMIAVHVNHGLRGETAERDETFTKSLCEQHGIICEIYREDVELIAKMRKQSLEEAGREVRRAAFWNAKEKYGANKIALAHHMNDNVETLLMNLARGTGIKGMGGMAPVNGEVIRPLLCLTRDEIEQYLRDNRIAYCIDETNASDDYTRNRIRNHVIPFLTGAVNEKAVPHMAEAMEEMRDIWQYMAVETRRYYEGAVRKRKRGLFISEESYHNISPVFQGNVLKEVIKEVAEKERDIQSVHIESLKKLMENQSGRKVNLPYGLIAVREYEGIYISPEEEKQNEEICRELDFASETEVLVGDTHISFKILDVTARKEEKIYTKSFDYDIMKNTVVIRTRKPGDYITIDKDGKTQKLKSYFINEKIPKEERDALLLLAEGSHVLWIIGYRRGYAYHVGEGTEKILEITINKGEK